MRKFNKIIEEIANELSIKVTFLADNWLTVLEYENKIRYISGYKFSLNDHGVGSIVDDKGLFYDLLVNKNIPIIEHKVIFKNYDKEKVLEYFNNHNQEIIVKGNIGTCGREVFKINNENSLFIKIDELFKSQFSISLCPYYDIVNEYRVIVLNNEAKLVYGKVRPIVIGDGKKSLKELALEFNPGYYCRQKNINKIDDYIPRYQEKVILNFQFNLSEGAVMFLDIDSDLKRQIINMALKVSRLVNLVFGSIDIIKTTDNRLMIMEANSGVMMTNYMRLDKINGYNVSKGIYKDAIKLMFEK